MQPHIDPEILQIMQLVKRLWGIKPKVVGRDNRANPLELHEFLLEQSDCAWRDEGHRESKRGTTA